MTATEETKIRCKVFQVGALFFFLSINIYFEFVNGVHLFASPDFKASSSYLIFVHFGTPPH